MTLRAWFLLFGVTFLFHIKVTDAFSIPQHRKRRDFITVPRLAVERKPRPVPPPASEEALVVRVCCDPKKSCGPRGGDRVLELMQEVAGTACKVEKTACVGPCSLGVNVVAGWNDSRGRFQRAGVARNAGDPEAQTSKSSLRKNKPGVYNKVQTREDCELVLQLLRQNADAALRKE